MSTPPSGSAEGGSAAWPEVDGPAEPEDGAAEADAGPSVRGAPGREVPRERVPLRGLDGRARVRRVLLRAGELREVLARDVHARS